MLTPFPHTKAFDELNRQKRIFSFDWDDYSGDKVVFYPRHMPPKRLEELLHYAWDAFYQDEPQKMKMFKLLKQVARKEMADNTFRPRKRAFSSRAFGKDLR